MGAYASHRYISAFDDARAHIRYIGFREREDKSESLGLFSEHSDSVDADPFIESLKAKRFKHPDVATVHTVLFSMSGREWEQSGFQPGDYQKMIRKVMKEWEIRKGYKLDWIAAEHRNPDHPHVHTVIRAAYKDRDGIERRLNISNQDRRFFREQFQEIKEQVRPLDPPERTLSYNRDKSLNLYIDSTFIDQLFYQIDRELEQEEWERENEKKKKINKKRGRSI